MGGPVADGAPGVERILKVGFLNDKVGRRPGFFMACFSFTPVNEHLLNTFCGLGPV